MIEKLSTYSLNYFYCTVELVNLSKLLQWTIYTNVWSKQCFHDHIVQVLIWIDCFLNYAESIEHSRLFIYLFIYYLCHLFPASKNILQRNYKVIELDMIVKKWQGQIPWKQFKLSKAKSLTRFVVCAPCSSSLAFLCTVAHYFLFQYCMLNDSYTTAIMHYVW